MKIVLNIKPQKMFCTSAFAKNMYAPTASTKNSIMTLIQGRTFNSTLFTIGNALHDPMTGTVRVYNLEKHRKVTALVTSKTRKSKTNPTGKPLIKSVVLTPGHWVAYVYDFQVAVLKATGLKVLQGNRTFKITKA